MANSAAWAIIEISMVMAYHICCRHASQRSLIDTPTNFPYRTCVVRHPRAARVRHHVEEFVFADPVHHDICHHTCTGCCCQTNCCIWSALFLLSDCCSRGERCQGGLAGGALRRTPALSLASPAVTRRCSATRPSHAQGETCRDHFPSTTELLYCDSTTYAQHIIIPIY